MIKDIRKNCLSKVFHFLKENKKATVKELVNHTDCSYRIIIGILNKLLEKDVIGKYRLFSDARVRIYYFKEKTYDVSHLDVLQNKARKDFHNEITKLNIVFKPIIFRAINHGKQIALYCVHDYKDTKRNLLFLAKDYIQANRKIIDMTIILTAIFG